MKRRAPLLAILVLAACAPPSPLVIGPSLPPSLPAGPPPEDPCRAARADVERAPSLLAAGQLDRAVRVLRRAEGRCPEVRPRGAASLVRALARLGKRDEARAEIAAIEADPRSTAETRAVAVEVRAALDAPAGSAPSAADLARMLAEADAALAEGVASNSRDKLSRARALYLAAAAGPSPDGDALHGAGRAERALGDAPAAQALFDWAVAAFEARAGEAAFADVAAEVRGAVVSAAFARGADRLAVSTAEALTVFDLRAMREHGRIPRSFQEVAFAGSDGAMLVAADEGGITTFDARSLRSLRRLEGPCAPLAASPRQPLVACGSPEGKVRIWDLEAGRERSTVADLGGPPLRLRFSRDGAALRIMTAGRLFSWDLGRQKLSRSVSAKKGWELRELFPLRDDKAVALLEGPPLGEPEAAHRLDEKTLAPRGKIPVDKALEEQNGGPPPSGVTARGAFSPDGRYHVSFDDGRMHDRAGKPVLLTGPHTSPLVAAAYSSDGKVLGASYESGAFRSFDAATGRPRKTYRQPWVARVMAFRTDGGEYVARLASSPRTAWSADGRVEARAHKQRLMVRDGTDRTICDAEGGTDEILVVAMAPDGGELVTLSATEALLWDAKRCTVKHPLPDVQGSTPAAAAFSPDGDTVAVAWRGARDELRLVDLAAQRDRLLATINAVHGARRIWFLAHGRTVALTDPLSMWEADTGKPIDRGAVSGTILTLSPDAQVVVTAGDGDGALRFSSVRTGQHLVALRAVGEGQSAQAIWSGATPAETRVDPLDDRAREALVCRIGPRAHAFELCAERAEVPGLFARALSGDRSFLVP